MALLKYLDFPKIAFGFLLLFFHSMIDKVLLVRPIITKIWFNTGPKGWSCKSRTCIIYFQGSFNGCGHKAWPRICHIQTESGQYFSAYIHWTDFHQDCNIDYHYFTSADLSNDMAYINLIRFWCKHLHLTDV